ncbi:MAG: hypothetical protein HKP31_07330 [Nitrosopumilus sp.]|nr:hypothetical protein [Nitrosopumilus sp.]
MKQLNEIQFLGIDTDINSIENTDEKFVVSFELEKEKELKEKGISGIYFNRQAQSEKTWQDIVKTAEEWLNYWPEKPLNKGKSIIEILKFEDTSLWWFVYDILWENKNGVFDTIYQIHTLISLIEEIKPNKIGTIGKFEFPIIEMLYALKNKYNFEISNMNKSKELVKTNSKTISKKRINFISRLMILKIIHLFSNKTKGSIAIFSTHGGILKRINEKVIASDQYFVGLEEFIEKNKNKMNFISLNKNITSKKFNELLKNTLNGKYEPWIVYYPFWSILSSYKKIKNFKKLFSEIENSSSFVETMTVKEINIFPFLRDQFVRELPFLIGYAHIELNAVKQFISKRDPTIIFTIDAFGVAGRALNYICKKNQKRVITPQLGIISPEFPVNTAFWIKNGHDLRLIPEFFTWGNHFKKLIEKKGFPQELIKTVGFWKTNTENQIKKNDEYFFYICGANQTKLEYVLSLDEEIFTIRMIYEALPKGLKLVVKLHPNLDEKPYFSTLDKLDNIILIGNKEAVDVNDLVSHSKAVIGKASTIIIQAMILDKPIINVNFVGNVNFLGFKEIPMITNIEDLQRIMNEIAQSKFENNYKIKEYCDPIGDEAISNVINELMKS